MLKIFYVGIGGFIGSALRYIVSVQAPKFLGTQLPYGTLIVNVAGGILTGLIMEISLATHFISPNFRLFLVTGIMGGFTTFSTFSYETINFFVSGNHILGLLNACLNLLLSLGGVILGKFASHIFIDA